MLRLATHARSYTSCSILQSYVSFCDCISLVKCVMFVYSIYCVGEVANSVIVLT